MSHARHTIVGVRFRRLSTWPEEALICSYVAGSLMRAWRTADDVATGSVATEGRRGLAGPLLSGRYVSSQRGCEEGATTRAMCPERFSRSRASRFGYFRVASASSSLKW